MRAILRFVAGLAGAALYLSATPVGLADTVIARLTPADHVVVGQVRSVEVQAYGTPPRSPKASLVKYDAVVQNEILETVATGSLAVTFLDGMDLTLGGNTKAVIDEFSSTRTPKPAVQ